MNSRFYIQNNIFKKNLYLLVLFYLFIPSFFYIYFCLFTVFLFLHRRKSVDLALLRTFDSNIIISPVTGVIDKITKENSSFKIEIKVGLFDSYGIFMPFSGDIINYTEEKSLRSILNIFDKEIILKKMKLKSKNSDHLDLEVNSSKKYLRKAHLFLRSGDLASQGALIGYLPLGGKIAIEIANQSDVLVKEGDIVSSCQTLIASMKGS